MTQAGWVSATHFREVSPDSGTGGIHWTPLGISRLQLVEALIREIEADSDRVTPEEMPFLRSWSQLVAMKNPPPPLPPIS